MPIKDRDPDLWVLILCIIFACVVVGNFIYIKATKDKPVYEYETYTVQKGDNLGDLAASYAAKDTDDLRDWVDKVKEINSMSQSGLIEGEEIIILTEE